MNTLPKTYPTDVLTEKQLEFLARKLPQPNGLTGRPAYTNLALLPGILRVLRSGCRWRDLNLPDYPDGVTHWRRLRFWKKRKGFTLVWNQVLRLLDQEKKLGKERVSIDGSLIKSFAFIDTTGYSGKHHAVGTKISTLTDATGIPLSVCFASGNRHDLILAIPTLQELQFAPSRLRLANLLADKGYDSKAFRQFVVQKQFVPFIPQRKNGKIRKKYQLLYLKNKTLQKERYVVEQTNSWLKSFRRLRHRFDYTLNSFEAFVYLAILVICVRRLLE